MSQFKEFADTVRRRFEDMTKHKLFVADCDGDALWAHYLASFPEGTNPVFRVRTEFDCGCCRHFVRGIGGVVSIENGVVTSVWDVLALPEPFQTVANTMAAYVKSHPIANVFVTMQHQYGQEITHEQLDGGVMSWNHFAVKIPGHFIRPKADEVRGFAQSSYDVFKRGLIEIKPEAVATVVELIEQGTLYRGGEFKHQILAFQALQQRYLAIADAGQQDGFVWANADEACARLRNSVVGTLLQDLSEDISLEDALRKYESKTAPANYKRPTAAITPRMVDVAMKTITALGLEPALARRHARLSDVNATAVLFVDSDVRPLLADGDGVRNLLMQETKAAPMDFSNAEVVNIDAFVGNHLACGNVQGLEVYLDNTLLRNFASLTAPLNADAPPLFKWNNNFGWSYDGNVTDSLKDKVKRAGGEVDDVDLRVSLEWYNADDLDLHASIPSNQHIFFGNKAGILDIDMNASTLHISREPVENMRWKKMPRDGEYKFHVNNFCRREASNGGFMIEIEDRQLLTTLRYESGLANKEDVSVASVHIKGGKVEKIEVNKGMQVGHASRQNWGLKTLSAVRVNALVTSPNHWNDNAIGHKHWFFILEGAKNPLPTRGIYNEFLSPALAAHRKVFEVLGDKTKCPVTDEQMSGVGFTRGRDDKVNVIVTSRSGKRRPYTITF